MISAESFKAIADLDLEPIKVKLMHVESGEGWSLEKVNAVEFEYRRFLYLMKMFPNEQTAPLMDVDIFWHYHILDTMKYFIDCENVFGYYLHHFPYIGLRGEEDEAAHERVGNRMKELYEETFGEDYFRSAVAYSGRVAAEAAADDGQVAYSGRVAAEAGQQVAYSGRVAAEAAGADPQVAYSGRVAAEAAPQVAYSGRVAPEAAPQVAYSGRVAAEAAPKVAYSGRVAAPQVAYSGRVAAEAAPKVAYSGRVAVETAPQVAYSGRVAAEASPKIAYSGRIAAEAGSLVAYSGRVAAEAQTAYSGRVTAEAKTAYSGRLAADAQTAYSGRVSAEAQAASQSLFYTSRPRLALVSARRQITHGRHLPAGAAVFSRPMKNLVRHQLAQFTNAEIADFVHADQDGRADRQRVMADLADHRRSYLQRTGQRSIVLQLQLFNDGIQHAIRIVSRRSGNFFQ